MCKKLKYLEMAECLYKWYNDKIVPPCFFNQEQNFVLAR